MYVEIFLLPYDPLMLWMSRHVTASPAAWPSQSAARPERPPRRRLCRRRRGP
jgi:hypothetical protein